MVKAQVGNKVVETSAATKARIVKVWSQVEALPDEAGEVRRFTVRTVMSEATGKAVVDAFRGLGIRCGYDYRFAGEKMSTVAQVRLMWAHARSKGYTG
jgi:hypothetical protein